MNGGQGMNVSHWITWMDGRDLLAGDVGRTWGEVIMNHRILQIDNGD